jgi:imidazolonepropionase-like amidohydrolase
MTVFTDCTLLDGSENMVPKKNMTVAVEDGRIVFVGENYAHGKAQVVDLGGRYLLPGLINAHVHLPGSGKPSGRKVQSPAAVRKLMGNPASRMVLRKMCEDFARTELMSGTTTIRTVGGLGTMDAEIRDKINNGRLTGPRMLVSNMAVSVPGGHMAGVLAYEATSAEECRAFVDKIAEGKPDIIKIMITGGVLDATVKGEPGVLKMAPELIKAACDRAHMLGFKVAAHAESPQGVKAALEGGVDTVEHGAKPDDRIIELFKTRGAADICTISPAVPLAKFPPEVTHSNDVTQYNGEIVMNGIIDSAAQCLKNGIPVGLGTDTACPFVTHYNMWREVFYFCKYVGVTPEFALYSATLGNARILGIDAETGSVAEGKSADLLVVSDDPLAKLSALSRPYMVVMKGRIFAQPKIKRIASVDAELEKAFPEA